MFVGCFLLLVAVGPFSGVAAAADTSAPDCSVHTYAGNGTEADPYRISTVDGLQCISIDAEAYYVLTSDIDASGTAEWNNGAGFDPVDLDTGLDGQGHTITGLTINRPNQSSVDLIRQVEEWDLDRPIENVSLEDANVTGGEYVGILVGDLHGENVSSVSVRGTVTVTGGSEIRAGGLVGSATDSSVGGNRMNSGNWIAVGIEP